MAGVGVALAVFAKILPRPTTLPRLQIRAVGDLGQRLKTWCRVECAFLRVIESYHPNTPCMAYLPTLTPEATPM